MMDKYKERFDEKSVKFNKKALSIIHLLHPYVKQRLRIGENQGVFRKNMFQANGIIDEVILSIYEIRNHEIFEFDVLRLMMFKLANSKLKKLYEKEEWHKKSISTEAILNEELKSLEENFTIDGGEDLVMNEDLDDISYHQNDDVKHYLMHEESQENVFSFLDISEGIKETSQKKKNILQKMYDNLPLQTTNVMDLYILGKLNLNEIAEVLEVDIVEVKKILAFVKENFKKRLV